MHQYTKHFCLAELGMKALKCLIPTFPTMYKYILKLQKLGKEHHDTSTTISELNALSRETTMFCFGIFQDISPQDLTHNKIVAFYLPILWKTQKSLKACISRNPITHVEWACEWLAMSVLVHVTEAREKTESNEGKLVSIQSLALL